MNFFLKFAVITAVCKGLNLRSHLLLVTEKTVSIDLYSDLRFPTLTPSVLETEHLRID